MDTKTKQEIKINKQKTNKAKSAQREQIWVHWNQPKLFPEDSCVVQAG